MRRLLNYINPMAHLGERSYSVAFPLLTTFFIALVLEYVFVILLNKPESIGLFAIFIFIGLIVYFAFREGIRGGLITSTITVLYYFYIIYSRDYTGKQLTSGIETTIVLGALYYLIAWIIGWLKERIDTLIEQEANEKQRLQSILQQLPVGVVVCDAQGNVTLANKYMETIIGRKVKDNIIVGQDTDPKATHRGKPVGATQWPLAQALTTGKTIPPKEIIFENVNGSRKFIQVSASAVHNKSGTLIAAATILNDITPLKEIEERKDDFVNMASHELKTPITSMRLYIESLEKKLKADNHHDYRKMVGGIKSQTLRLQNLVSDLLDVSRLQTGKLVFTKEVTDLSVIIRQTVDELKETTKNHTVVIKSNPRTLVYADSFRIYQVITNLLTNAIKYSPENTTIEIRVQKSGANAIISVKDQGIGISKDQLTKVFERLYQVNTTNEKSFPGLGMGLYIAKEIIRNHHGKIWVESKRAKGSTFFFSLPITKK